MKRFGLTEDILKKIPDNDKQRILSLCKLRNNAFTIKDILIYDLIKDLNHDREVEDDSDLILDSRPSYGIYTSAKKNQYGQPMYQIGGEPMTENRLIVDIPFFGQFCVHLLNENSISALSKTPYNALQRFHEKRSVFLTENISGYGQEVIDELKREGVSIYLDISNVELLNRLKNLRKQNPRFAHYLALKLGADKDVIDYIYSDKPDNSKDNDEGEIEI